MNLNQKHLISLLSYLWVGFIGWSISHGFFSWTRSVIMAIIGFALFLLGELLNKDDSKSRTHVIIFWLLYSLSIGMISGWFQHFLDSPSRSLWIVPIGFLISRLVFGAKNQRQNFNWKSVILGIITTVWLYGILWSAIRYLPSSVYSSLAHIHNDELWHDNQTTTWTQHTMDHNDHNNHTMDSMRMMSWADTQTKFMLPLNGTTTWTVWTTGSLVIRPEALVGGDAVQIIEDLQIVHEKYIHLILVRNDGWDFLHLHPDPIEMGNRSTQVLFPSAGTRTIYADLVSKEFGPQVLTWTLTVDGTKTPYTPTPVQGTWVVITKWGKDYTISWSNPSSINATYFDVISNQWELQPYLGALWHMVAINLDTMDYSHVHPIIAPETNHDHSWHTSWHDNQKTSFMAHFTKPWIYALFIQVQVDNEIVTLPVTIEVK